MPELETLAHPASTRIVFVVMDGLGGYADATRGTELEEAHTPNLDALATEGALGLLDPVAPGITPGSGPGHLALFGYDPDQFQLGRGVLSAAGLDVHLRPGDVAARGNLATLDRDGAILDRRARRIPDVEARAIVELLQREVRVDGIEVVLRHEAQHRVLVVFRGAGLDPAVTETDPQRAGVPPAAPLPLQPAADRFAAVVTEFDQQVCRLLAGRADANTVLLRGFDTTRALPSMRERYQLRPAAVAIYPMYRGIAGLLGMDVLPRPDGLAGQIETLQRHWDAYDFYFVHHKGTDTAGEDGDFAGKVAAIEALDAAMPAVRELAPDVIVVTGDHATPSQLAAHSWHPVPVLVWAQRVGRDECTRFGERWCRHGALGRRPTKELMGIALACAGRLGKFGP